jgi:hypothetical protein
VHSSHRIVVNARPVTALIAAFAPPVIDAPPETAGHRRVWAGGPPAATVPAIGDRRSAISSCRQKYSVYNLRVLPSVPDQRL